MRPTSREIAGLVFALLPFLIKFGDRRTTTVDGVVRVLWDYNYAGVIFGIAALIAVFLGWRDLKEHIGEQSPVPHYALLAAISVLAVYQIAKGASFI